ncbi:MAG: hypothetical protein Q8M16_00240 [Pirellulaceae bacterium]|nr:hypothetical protein [Pirellulaceae bacterium]
MNKRKSLSRAHLLTILGLGILGLAAASQFPWAIIYTAAFFFAVLMFVRAVLMYRLKSVDPPRYRDPNYRQAESTLLGKFSGDRKTLKQRGSVSE